MGASGRDRRKPSFFFLRAGVPLRPEQVLDEAFTARYEGVAADVEIYIDDGHGSSRERRLSMLTKLIDERIRSLGRVQSPEYLRCMGLLNIETEIGGENSFVFLPAIGRVRRVSSAERSGAFLGSDLTFEDFQRLRGKDFDVALLARGSMDGEAVLILDARPRLESQYDRVQFAAADTASAIPETRYYTRASRTDLLLHDLKIKPKLDDHVFSLKTLLRQIGGLPEVAR